MTLLEKLRCLFTFGQGVALPLPEISSDSTPLTLFTSGLMMRTNQVFCCLKQCLSVAVVTMANQAHAWYC